LGGWSIQYHLGLAALVKKELKLLLLARALHGDPERPSKLKLPMTWTWNPTDACFSLAAQSLCLDTSQ